MKKKVPIKPVDKFRQQKIEQLNRDIELGLSQIKSGKIVSGEAACKRVTEKIKAIAERKK